MEPDSELPTRQDRACAEKSHTMDTVVSCRGNVLQGKPDSFDWKGCHQYVIGSLMIKQSSTNAGIGNQI